jgi:hypothetical protein
MPQLIAAIPSALALIILVRYFPRGSIALTRAGFVVFALNLVTSVTLLIYLSTLPVYFR